MADKIPGSISLTDQILETLFSRLDDDDGFNMEIISQLRALAKRNELTKVEKVATVLNRDNERDDETP